MSSLKTGQKLKKTNSVQFLLMTKNNQEALLHPKLWNSCALNCCLAIIGGALFTGLYIFTTHFILRGVEVPVIFRVYLKNCSIPSFLGNKYFKLGIPFLFFFTTKSWENHPQKLLRNTQICFTHRATVYRTEVEVQKKHRRAAQ